MSMLAQLKIKRMELVEKRTVLRVEARALAQQIPMHISPNLFDEVEDMEVVEASRIMDSLCVTHSELLVVCSKIEKLDRELG